MKILLVEDARSVVKVMTARLSSYGHDVVHAENGQVAVDLFEKESPDLILMDIEMPVMNGFEAANRIRAVEANQQWAWTPIIFLTSSDTVQNLVTAIEAGGDDFMSKMVPEPVLKAKMKAMSRIAALRHSLSIANRKLQTLADHDGLTGLCNRRSMDARIEEFWMEPQSNAALYAVLMLDIDNFKKYNDHYGHQAGDDCLRQVAIAIEGATEVANVDGVTKGAFVARYGGEEFAVLIPGASQFVLESFSTSILNAVRQLAIKHDKNADWGIVTVSIGGHCVDTVSAEIKDLFRAADARLYRAKNNGRNRAEIDG